jgi:hypothetical protein
VAFEVRSISDPCIYKGSLLSEPSTEVLVTGGCKGEEDSFEVKKIIQYLGFGNLCR